MEITTCTIYFYPAGLPIPLYVYQSAYKHNLWAEIGKDYLDQKMANSITITSGFRRVLCSLLERGLFFAARWVKSK